MLAGLQFATDFSAVRICYLPYGNTPEGIPPVHGCTNVYKLHRKDGTDARPDITICIQLGYPAGPVIRLGRILNKRKKIVDSPTKSES